MDRDFACGRLFDFHADTACRMFYEGLSFDDCRLHINERALNGYRSFAQVFAIWSECEKSNDDCYKSFLPIIENLRHQLSLSRSVSQMRCYISLEDARILDGRWERVEQLAATDIVLVTPLWKGESCIGGAWDTCVGLSDFGSEACRYLARQGILLDISHASLRSAEQLCDICTEAGLPIIASHSNSHTVYPHERNLPDALLDRIIQSGGIVGVNLFPAHLNGGVFATTEDVVRHIEHYLSLGAERNLAFGCDFDGISTTPAGLDTVAELPLIATALSKRGYPSSLLSRLFYRNGEDFAEKYFRRVFFQRD